MVGTPHLAFLQQKMAQQTTPQGRRMVHSLSGLMKMSIGFLPIEDPHPEKTRKYAILEDFIVHGHELRSITNHIRPERIVIVEFRKGVINPTRVPMKSISVLLAWEDSVPSPTIGDLVLRQCVFQQTKKAHSVPGTQSDMALNQSYYGHDA